MSTKEFKEIKDVVEGLIQNLQQKTGNQPKEVVWKLLNSIQGIKSQNDLQKKFKNESLDKIEELYPEFLLSYKKDFNKSKLEIILKDLEDNTKSIEGDKDFELHNYINQIKDKVVRIKGNNTHKTKTQTLNEILEEMEYNFQVIHGKNEFLRVENDSTELIENLKCKYQSIKKNNIQTVWDKVDIGKSTVKLHNLEIQHGEYITNKIKKELDSEFMKNVDYSKTTQSKYTKLVLDEDSTKIYSKSNGSNNSELKLHPYMVNLKSDKCLENISNLTLSKLSSMKNLKTIEDFKKVLNGDDDSYNKLIEEEKVNRDNIKVTDENKKIKDEYSSIESTLKTEIKRLDINPPKFTEKDYELYRKKNHKDLILDLLKDNYQLHKDKDHWKSKFNSVTSEI